MPERNFHVWFSTKHRKPVLVEEIRELVLAWFNEVATAKGINILQLEAIEDHVHILLRLTPDQALPDVMHDLKGRTAREVFRTFPELPLDMKSNSLWQRSYGWRVVPPEQIRAVQRYIATQEFRPFRHEQEKR
jgi:putative transposase